MSGFVNQLTSPLGVKLFSGGPYADNGIGDQQGALAQQGQANTEQFLAQLAPIIAQIAQAAGVANPLEKGAAAPFATDPYGLSPLQQASLNEEQSITTDAYDKIMSKVKANLSARGLGNSSALTAAETYLQKQMQGQLGQERVAAGQNAYGNRQNALGQIGQLLGTGYGAQQNSLGQQQNVLESQKQTALQSNQNAMSQLGSALALGLYGGKIGPFAKPAGLPQGGILNATQSVPNWYQGTGEPDMFSAVGKIPWSSIYG